MKILSARGSKINIVVGTRCLNEQELLPVFLSNYPFADAIVIADGGSTDRSKDIATADQRVIWSDFKDRVQGKNGGWRNPEGRHMNFLIDACESLNPDWLWITEVDAIPNLNLQRDAISILSEMDARKEGLLSTWLCYVSPGSKEHYPDLMQGPGFTAWKPGAGRAEDNIDYEGQGNLHINTTVSYNLSQEFSRIHLTFESEELIARKSVFYQDVHGWSLAHPDVRCGPRAPLPEWAKWHDPRRSQ